MDKNHAYRKVLEIVDFKNLCKPLHKCYSSNNGEKAYMERFLKENLAGKLFCGFGLLDNTPDHSYFGKLRDRFGIDKIVELHNTAVSQLKSQNVVSEVFTVLDSTSVISKLSIWRERDRILAEKSPPRLKAIQKNIPSVDLSGNLKEATSKEEIKTTNKNISNYAIDKDAKIGNKGKNKYWYGYKRHVAVDCKSGIITNVEVTPANILDHDERVLDKILPTQGMVLTDRGYDTNKVEDKVAKRNLVSGIRKRKIRKNRDPDRDKWVTRLWSPFESVFRYADKVTLYKGLSKVKFHQVLDTFALNLKRLVRINGTPLFPVIKLA